MRTTVCLTVTFAAAALSTMVPAGAKPPIQKQPIREYVALGDSWAADAAMTGVSAEFVPLACAQSATSYAKLVAQALAVAQFRDASCASAVTTDLSEPQALPDGTVNPPQFDRLTPDTDLVTLEIGGNDAGLAAIVPTCLTTSPHLSNCARMRTAANGEDSMSVAIRTAEPKVAAAITAVRDHSPHARILLVDYLAGVSPGTGCYPHIPITDEDANWLGHKLIELDTMLARVAAKAGTEFVDTYTGSIGHDACRPTGTRWVEGLLPASPEPAAGLAAPFHPNQLGANHQAQQILRTLHN